MYLRELIPHRPRRRGVTVALAALAAVMLLGSQAGCSSTDAGPSTKQDANASLEIWIRQAPESDSAKTAQRLADAFTAKTGVKTKLVPLFDEFETKLQQQAAQKDLPDIVINDTAQLGNMRTQGWVVEVDRAKVADGDKLADRAWNAAKGSDGKYYGVPFSAQAFAMFVRADWRKKLGLPEPKTWDDLAAMAAAFTTQDPDGNGKADTRGLVVPGGTKRGYMSWYFSTYLWANGGDFLAQAGEGKWRPAVTDDKSLAALAWMRDMFCGKKVVNPDATTLDTTRAHEVFEKGLGGMYLTGPYMLARFVGSMGTDKLEVFPVPNGPDGGPGALAEGENVYLMAGSPNTKGQRRFADFAASPEGQRVGMNGDKPGAIVRLPVHSGVDLATERQDPRWKVFADVYNSAGVYTPNVPNWAPFRQLSAEAINAVMANCQSDPKQAMTKLASQFDEELTKQGVHA